MEAAAPGTRAAKLDDVAAVGGEIGNLGRRNGLADFVGVRLNLNGVRFDGDALFGLTDLQARVGTDSVIHVQRDAGSFGRL